MTVIKKRFIILSSLLCYLVCLGDPVVLFYFSKKFPGYSHLSELISELGSSTSPVTRIFSTWWIIAGIVFIIFGVGFFYSFSSEGKTSRYAAWLLILYAIGDCLASGLFKDDHFHGGLLTLASKVHVVLGAIGIFALLAFPVVMQKIYTREINSKFYYFSWVVFYTGIMTTALLFFRYYYVQYLTDLQGLWQRITLISFYIYFIVIATMMINKIQTAGQRQEI